MRIFENLKKDHNVIKHNINKLVTLADMDYESACQLSTKTYDLLIAHSRAEEIVLYNFLEAATGSPRVEHNYEEHVEAESVLRVISNRACQKEAWKNLAWCLKTVLELHIHEEEKLFAAAGSLLDDKELWMMGDAFKKLENDIRQHGFSKESFDLAMELMPSRLVEKERFNNLELQQPFVNGDPIEIFRECHI